MPVTTRTASTTIAPLDGIDLEQCAAMQQEEREVLESIYPACISSGASGQNIRLEVPVEFSEPTLVTVQDEALKHDMSSTPQDVTQNARLLFLSTLPPISLDLCLPRTYPFMPPQIRAVHATHSWMATEGTSFLELLAAKWSEGEGVLYTWVEWIRSGEFLEELSLTSLDSGRRVIRIFHPTPTLLLPALEKYSTSTDAARFSQNSYECEVCLTSIKGAHCIMLSCSHVFCRSCLEDFWKLCIKEGEVGRVGCPDPGCVKEHKEATEEEVRRIVTEEEILRWKWLHMKRDLEKDPTLVHCPMAMCQTPVPRQANVEEDSPWARLRTCSNCGYSFCAYCKRTWHGPVANCPISATKAILLEYMALEDGSKEKRAMELRYGKIPLQRLVTDFEQERAFYEWVEKSMGRPCPGCEMRYEKHSGCNHMTCAKCGQHFCYRCGVKLDRNSPYRHFSTPGLRCFSKLFDLEDINNDWQPVEGFAVL
ncbi:uncharacterized protein BXZ73DRAFT_51599 [Epithele typhae]|uniref:uncharacterized protein n=1 Tax=Epithele typhae TaxID=378194 RepID=UPI0020087DBA|nr:uncharacterized protein BXZ73DRAFT_51599 [Epithele typhae]KAH9921958.1 hypothetical protein BXZ73DRAFT_51599 [Epithele typhae]